MALTVNTDQMPGSCDILEPLRRWCSVSNSSWSISVSETNGLLQSTQSPCLCICRHFSVHKVIKRIPCDVFDVNGVCYRYTTSQWSIHIDEKWNVFDAMYDCIEAYSRHQVHVSQLTFDDDNCVHFIKSVITSCVIYHAHAVSKAFVLMMFNTLWPITRWM